MNNLRVGYVNEYNSKKSAQKINIREFKQNYENNNIEYLKNLDVKSIEAFKFISEENRNKVFQFLDK